MESALNEVVEDIYVRFNLIESLSLMIEKLHCAGSNH